MSDAGDRPDRTTAVWDEQFTVPVPAGPAAPPAPPNPYAGRPAWPADPARPAARTADPTADPLLEQLGVALFWIAVGWWVFVLLRVLGEFTRHGMTDTILIRTIDDGPEETVVAAVLSVLAAALLLLGRGRGGRTPLGWSSLGLAVATVSVAVWRLVP
jgi:hypothetical protein